MFIGSSTRYAIQLKIRRLSFSSLLPVVVLVLWTVCVLMPTLVMAYRLNKVAHGADYVRLQFGTFEQIVPRHRWLAFALERVSFATWQPIAAINIPGTAVEALISLPLSWPYLWKPNELSLYAWRTLSLPFFCLPAWWLVGRGLDGLVRRIHLHWVVP